MAAGASTQQFVAIDHIRDGVVILKGGAMRGVLHVSSINFALKSTEEQDAIIYSFQNFLNSLDFPIQIFINSRFLNIEDYLDSLREIEKTQVNDLLRIQTQEYINFVKEFVEGTSIVSTDFFVIVPLRVQEVRAPEGSAMEGIKSTFGFGAKPTRMPSEQFAHYKSQLNQRMDFVAAGLHRMGLAVRPMKTEELIMLFWNLYNPQDLRKRTLVRPLFEKYSE